MPPSPTAATADLGADEAEIVVVKFGGTSVATAELIRVVAGRLVELHEGGQRVVCVLSAMGDTTDRLIGLARTMAGDPDPRELDALLAVGESISCALAAIRIRELGHEAVSLSGAQAAIATDGAHGHAKIVHISPARVRAELERGRIVLVTGFQGLSPDGDVTTLGRGGSDLTAVALAAALDAASCEIYTDVAGVFTADPRVVPEARKLEVVGVDEVAELAAGGARVLQLRAAELAHARRIPVHVRSTFARGSGTRIVPKGEDMIERSTAAGIAHTSGELLFRIRGIGITQLLAAAARDGVTVAGVADSDAGVMATVADDGCAALEAALERLGASWSVDEVGSVSIVGAGLSRDAEVATAVFGTLHELGIALAMVAVSPLRITVHLRRDHVEHAVRALHAALGLESALADTTWAA
jgi:aspartate kinase